MCVFFSCSSVFFLASASAHHLVFRRDRCWVRFARIHLPTSWTGDMLSAAMAQHSSIPRRPLKNKLDTSGTGHDPSVRGSDGLLAGVWIARAGQSKQMCAPLCCLQSHVCLLTILPARTLRKRVRVSFCIAIFF